MYIFQIGPNWVTSVETQASAAGKWNHLDNWRSFAWILHTIDYLEYMCAYQLLDFGFVVLVFIWCYHRSFGTDVKTLFFRELECCDTFP